MITTIKIMPSKGDTPSAETINDLDSPTRERPGKAFETLRAAIALHGHTLHRIDPLDGPVTYCAERWGLVRHLPTLNDATLFLEKIGGRV